MNSEIIYFDNAATSFPKPDQTLEAMQRCLEGLGGHNTCFSEARHELKVVSPYYEDL